MTLTASLTVVVPVYNGVDTIEECLDSIFRLPSSEVMCIVVDDGSTDGTAGAVTRFMQTNSLAKIQLVSQPNAGVSAARNRGLVEATGHYVMFVDADDLLAPGWLSAVNESLSAHQDSDVLVFSGSCKDGVIGAGESLMICLGGGSKRDSGTLRSAMCCPFSKLFARRFLKESSILFPTNVRVGEDVLFNASAFAAGARVTLCSKSIYLYRKNMTSATNRIDARYIDNELAYHHELKRILRTSDLATRERQRLMDLSYLSGLIGIVARSATPLERASIRDKLPDWSDYEAALARLADHLAWFPIDQRCALILLRNGQFAFARCILSLAKSAKKAVYMFHGGRIVERI